MTTPDRAQEGVKTTEIGETVRFTPAGWTEFQDPARFGAETTVLGKVVEINESHRWYRVEYRAGEAARAQHEVFKF